MSNTPKVQRQYVRDRKGAPVGVLLAVKSPNKSKYHIGWSMCNRKLDKFDKKIANELAMKRVHHAMGLNITMDLDKSVPHEVVKMLPMFQLECNRHLR